MNSIAELILNTVDVHVLAGIGMLLLSAAALIVMYIYVFNKEVKDLEIVFKFNYIDMGHCELMPHEYLDIDSATDVLRKMLVVDKHGVMVPESILTVYYAISDPNSNKRTSALFSKVYEKRSKEEIINDLEDYELRMEMKNEKTKASNI